MLCVHPRALPVIYWKLVLLAVSEIEFGALENQIVYLFQSFVGFFHYSKLPSNSHCHDLYLSAPTPVAAVCTML